VWDYVKLGIEEVLRKSHIRGMRCPLGCNDRDHFFYKYKPEDVYLSLRTGKSSLYMTRLRGQITGFGVCQKIASVDLCEPPFLLAWIGWSNDRETVGLYFKELEKLAASLMLREIRLTSTRKGWLIRKPTPDWEILSSQGWVKEVDPYQMRMAPEVTLRRRV
jgi:hypothetical protein